jgi:RNA polymerase sigma-70 factor, ECF subfamily
MGERSSVRGGLTSADREVLDGLVRDFGPRLLAYIRRVWGDRDAEDVLAEAFCRAAANMSVLRATARQDLYLLTIARNLCRDAWRRRRPTPTANEYLASYADGSAQPSESLGQTEQVDALRAAVSALPDKMREIVVLRLSGGLTFEEIAALLEIPLGTALSRMHAALDRLRNMLTTADNEGTTAAD